MQILNNIKWINIDIFYKYKKHLDGCILYKVFNNYVMIRLIYPSSEMKRFINSL